MNSIQKWILDSIKKNNSQILKSNDLSLPPKANPEELAQLYTFSALIATCMDFLIQQHWIQIQSFPLQKIQFKNFLSAYFENELRPIFFMKESLLELQLVDIQPILKLCQMMAELSITQMKCENFIFKKEFSISVLKKISDFFEHENQMLIEKNKINLPLEISLYRTFDALDAAFDLDYKQDIGMKVDLLGTERLYEGAGIGVQSGYSTVLTALRYLNPSKNSRFIDLGSGYGRVGFVVGLLRPDIDFIGYEYVPHRIDVSNKTSKNFELQDHVHFHTQNLSQIDFKIPEAEIYYLYDPFSKETYQHVLSQLVEISHRKNISIVTKGNARGWLLEISANEKWPAPLEFDNSNLCLFRSA